MNVASIETILPALKSILALELGLNLDPKEISDDAVLVDGGLNLDSIVLIELIGILEGRFGFVFQDADLRMATFASVETLANTIRLRVGG